jgi:hypothetical protein
MALATADEVIEWACGLQRCASPQLMLWGDPHRYSGATELGALAKERRFSGARGHQGSRQGTRFLGIAKSIFRGHGARRKLIMRATASAAMSCHCCRSSRHACRC